MNVRYFGWTLGLFILFGVVCTGKAQGFPKLRIAVAANFLDTAKTLAKVYERTHQVSIELISGSSGQLATQILQGAPFDVFLSADTHYPEQLIKYKKAHLNSLTPYAVGKVVLVHPYDQKLSLTLLLKKCTRIAIANPKYAPYGQAAMAFLKSGPSHSEKKVIIGENVGQVLGFLKTKAVDCGFIGLAQFKSTPSLHNRHVLWVNPKTTNLTQAAVVIVRPNVPKDAFNFVAFLKTKSSGTAIQKAGYDLP